MKARMRRNRWPLVAYVLLTIAVFLGFLRLEQIAERNAQANVALCVLRGDLERRVADSQEFLKDNPSGIPGIPASQIRVSIENMNRTIVALDVLHCPPTVP